MILPLILTIPAIEYLFDNRLVLFPNPEYTNRFEASTSPNGTIVDFQVDSKKISFSYILRQEPDDLPIPYSSVVIWLTRENTFFDLSGYDSLFLEIEKATAGKVVIFIKTFEKGISKPEKSEGLTLRHNEYTLSFINGVSGYNINIKNFFTPDWWFDMMNVPLNKRFKETYKKVSAFDLQFIHRSKGPVEEKEDSFMVRKIMFRKSYPVLYIILNIATALYCIFLFSVIFANRKGIIKMIKENMVPRLQEVEYRQLKLENYADNELDRIMNYLKDHYPDPEISSTLISRVTGIPRSHIAELIKRRYDCTCKQLINRIRITEAKRLLKTTDRRILEIALEVGFNDISTFNRCFKQIEGIAPSRYRFDV
ncbi:MAG: helix-turn-helix transcriptional regulator [Spirochaetales bacterium]|nr:helix-turn-helix transcriptional regulator [Spirochaetales bacterium]